MLPKAFECWFVEEVIVGAFEHLLKKFLRARILKNVEGVLCFSLKSSAQEFDDELAFLDLMLTGTRLML